MSESHGEAFNWKKELWGYVKILVFSLVFVWLLTTFIARPVQVSGSSMYPTLQDGEIGFTSILSLRIDGISHNDVVVAYLAEKDELIVKRVIGLPYDRVRCEDGVLYVNDEPADQSYLDQDYVVSQLQFEEDRKFTKDFEEIELGADEYFLMGDNRLHSSDSRVFGVFHRDDIKSKNVYVLYPFDRMRTVE